MLTKQCKMKVHEFSIGWALKQPNVEAALQQVMNNVKSWTGAKSETFSALSGEDVTHGDVVRAHACLLGVIFGDVRAGMAGPVLKEGGRL